MGKVYKNPVELAGKMYGRSYENPIEWKDDISDVDDLLYFAFDDFGDYYDEDELNEENLREHVGNRYAGRKQDFPRIIREQKLPKNTTFESLYGTEDDVIKRAIELWKNRK